jgi:hypothetical protein
MPVYVFEECLQQLKQAVMDRDIVRVNRSLYIIRVKFPTHAFSIKFDSIIREAIRETDASQWGPIVVFASQVAGQEFSMQLVLSMAFSTRHQAWVDIF